MASSPPSPLPSIQLCNDRSTTNGQNDMKAACADAKGLGSHIIEDY